MSNEGTPPDGVAGTGTPRAAAVIAAAVNDRGRLTAWSREAQSLLGYRPADVLGRPAFALLGARLPEYARWHLAHLRAWSARVVLRDRDGGPVEVDLRACPLTDAEGRRQWFIEAVVPPESDGAARDLQRSQLQRRVPAHLAVETAARYLPADPQAGVGGDWFDVIPLSGARVALVVGDVVGHGIHASAAMGRLRTAVRTLADVDLPPDELLADLDDLVLEQAREGAENAGEIGATCVYAVYDPVARHCVMASAGHPPPAVVSPGGVVDFVDVEPGPPLGVGGVPFENTELSLPEDSLLVMYTDGLVEDRDHDIDAGLQHLRRALEHPASSLDTVCDTLLRQLVHGDHADDAALLVARPHALGASHVVTWQVANRPAAVADARRRAAGQLTRWGLPEAVPTTKLIVSELVTNAIRHAQAPIQLRLIHNGTLICEVSDASNTSPHLRRARILDEGGRGLLLVGRLCHRWGTRHTSTGKTIWAEQAGHERPLPR